MESAEIVLGNRYEDSVTGFTGQATGIAKYLHSGDSVLLEAPVTPDGKTPDIWVKTSRVVPAAVG